MPTHKKKIDRDKYYNLAKEQGYRSRAAFKLIQINKKHDFLSKARVCIDLCAAPGGWCQVAAKVMPADSVVLGIDLLPIRPIRNVKTIVSDITTAECRALVKREIPQGWQADVVLCDGAPNVGSAYVKDAFVQNELALAALKTATDHLGKGGTFCTKVYRSQDYNALLWVFKQLFEEVQAVKPSSSRTQSAEIFVLCTQYRAPSSLDPRLLDPAHVFKQVELEDDLNKKPSIFDKAYGVQKRHRTGYDDAKGQGLRNSFGVAAFVESADPGQFLADADRIEFFGDSGPDGEEDSEGEEDEEEDEEGDEEADANNGEAGKGKKEKKQKVKGLRKLFEEHSSTSEEVKACCRDLRVLNKGDFKLLLKWRLRLREFRAEVVKKARKNAARGGGEGGSDDDGSDDDEGGSGGGPRKKAGGGGDEETEEGIMSALEARQHEARMKARREKKKQREAASKLRTRKALGMAHNAFEAPQDDHVFSIGTALKASKKAQKLKNKELQQQGQEGGGGVAGSAMDDAVSKVSLSAVTDEAVSGGLDEAKKGLRSNDVEVDEYDSDLDEEELDKLLGSKVEGLLESSYQRFLGRRSSAEVRGTKAHKRSKSASRHKAAALASEDAEAWEDQDGSAYAKLLNKGSKAEKGKKKKVGSDGVEEDDADDDGSSSDSSDEDDGFFDVPGGKRAKRSSADDDADAGGVASAAASRWFSDSVFKGMGVGDDANNFDDDDEDDEEEEEEKDANDGLGLGANGGRGRSNRQAMKKTVGVVEEAHKALGVFMPLTDKEERQAKRRKMVDRNERQTKRRERRLEDNTQQLPGLEIVAGDNHKTQKKNGDDSEDGEEDEDDDDDEEGGERFHGGEDSDDDEAMNAGLEGMEAEAAAKVKAKRALLKAGMGLVAADESGKGRLTEVEFVPSSAAAKMPPRADDRLYDSDNEEYDSEDERTTLALGTLMLRKSRAKTLVDASYNRFAWNDPTDLPEWFVDDEQKHYRPQLPIPKPLLDSIKQRFEDLTAKPIKKVAEARARKRKRSADKLKAAKKKAEALSNAPDMSDKEKLKAIAKAMASGSKQQVGKDGKATNPMHAKRKLVVMKKSMGGTAPKGSGKVKMVDRRMRSENHAKKRIDKKKNGRKHNKDKKSSKGL